jgi:DNA (cytosine-5)-methyltransferase 1
MVARLQGWDDEWGWQLAGRKTAQYRQLGNAFPPPVAEAVGRSIIRALEHAGQPHDMPELASASMHDPVYRGLREAGDYLSQSAIVSKLTVPHDAIQLERRIAHLSKDFIIEMRDTKSGPAYTLGEFKAFIGQKPPCTSRNAFTHGAGRASISCSAVHLCAPEGHIP